MVNERVAKGEVKNIGHNSFCIAFITQHFRSKLFFLSFRSFYWIFFSYDDEKSTDEVQTKYSLGMAEKQTDSNTICRTENSILQKSK